MYWYVECSLLIVYGNRPTIDRWRRRRREKKLTTTFVSLTHSSATRHNRHVTRRLKAGFVRFLTYVGARRNCHVSHSTQTIGQCCMWCFECLLLYVTLELSLFLTSPSHTFCLFVRYSNIFNTYGVKYLMGLSARMDFINKSTSI